MNLDYIIPPVSKELIKNELTAERFVRITNKADNEIYIVNFHNSPNVMQEVGRLRELTFAMSGGGTGEEVDIDELDTSKDCYEQLIVWSPKDEEIVGGYRFIDCSKISGDIKDVDISTKHYFDFSKDFTNNYLPKTIELGRSWVQPDYQPSATSRKGLFTLDNLWDGLGALIVLNPNIEYFFGKVTMYTSYNKEARDKLLTFMDCFFPDNDKLVFPKRRLKITHNMESFINEIKDLDYKQAHKLLSVHLKEKEERIPPLINSYMNLSATMKTFGTAENPDFGDVEETGILVKIKDMYTAKTDRHIGTFKG